MGDYRKAHPGDPFDGMPAALYNELIDGAAERRRGRAQGGSAVAAGDVETAVIRVKNGTAEPLPRFGVVGLTDAVIDPADNLAGFQQAITLTARAPELPDDAGRFAVLVQSIAPGEVGYAIVIGACHVQVDVGSEDDAFADVADGTTDKLTSSATSGAQILWKQSGTGVKWAVVRLGGGGGAESKGELDGQVHQMTSQNEDGWADLRLVNRG